MNNPYELIKSFYKDWDKIKDRDKSRNFFMVNRICSIKFPLQSNAFNHIKIQPEKAVDFLKVLVTSQHRTSPQWVWTKTEKKEIEKKKKETYDDNIIQFIKEKYLISNREIQEMIEFSPKDFKSFYKEIESMFG
jgi:hypothetical protein